MDQLVSLLQKHVSSEHIQSIECAFNEVTLTIDARNWLDVATILHQEKSLSFDVLIDVCAVDYLHFGQSEWVTEKSTFVGFSRAITEFKNECVGESCKQCDIKLISFLLDFPCI